MARRAKPRGTGGKAVPVGDLAHAAVRQLVPPDRLRLVRVQLRWDEIAPGPLRAVSWAGGIQGTTLIIHVADNQWLHELTYLRGDLLERIQTACPGAKVGALRLRVGEIPERTTPPPPLEKPGPPPLADEPSGETLEALRDVEDPSLRQAMANARLALSRRLRG